MQRLRYSVYLKGVFTVIDLLLIIGVYAFLYPAEILVQNTEVFIISALLMCALWFFLSGRTKIYTVPRSLTLTLYLERLAIQTLFFLVGAYLITRLNKENLPDNTLTKFSIASSTVIFSTKILFFYLLKQYRKSGKNLRNVMFFGSGESTEILKSILHARSDYGYKVFQFDQQNLDIKALEDFWIENGIYSVFIPLDHAFTEVEYDSILQAAENCGVTTSLVPENIFSQQRRYQIEYFEVQPVLKIAEAPLQDASNYLFKRTFDILFSFIFLILIGIWLIPIIGLVIMIDSKGAAFFVQERYGYRNKTFNCIKFRTMVPNKDSDRKTTLANDERITSVGRFLRKTSLDEIPQFINVLLGDMSVVGPRPHMLVVDDQYKNSIAKYPIRSTVRPGITGLAQMRGFRGDHDNMKHEMKQRVKSDLFYINNWSFSLDLIIILKTLGLIFKGDKKAH